MGMRNARGNMNTQLLQNTAVKKSVYPCEGWSPRDPFRLFASRFPCSPRAMCREPGGGQSKGGLGLGLCC